MPGPDKEPLLKFANELLIVFIRWSEESALDELDMAEAAVTVINNFCNEETINFEPDSDFLGRAHEDPEEI